MKFKYCFINDGTCSEQHKEAHILSRAATMSLVHGSTKAGLQVVHLGAKSQNGELTPSLIGWKKASAHYCFCHDHDNDLFEPIENDNILDPKNLEQLFLHSLRSFAYAYYRKKKELHPINDFMESIINIKLSISNLLNSDQEKEKEKEEADEMRNRFDMHFWAYESIRKELLSILENKDFHKMAYETAVIDKRFPFASAGVLMAQIVDPEQKQWTIVSYDSKDPILKNPAIILTVLPDKLNRTILIVGALRSDQNATMTLERFSRLSGKDFRKAISSLMIGVNKENTFFNPCLWEYMQQIGIDKQIINEVNQQRGLDLLSQPLTLSEIDLFADEFTCDNLNIK